MMIITLSHCMIGVGVIKLSYKKSSFKEQWNSSEIKDTESRSKIQQYEE